MTGALDRMAGGGENVTSGGVYGEMKGLAGDHPLYDFSVLNIGAVVQQVVP